MSGLIRSIKDIECLENIQKRAMKLVAALKRLPFEERLQRLSLQEPKDRGVRDDLIETLKIITGKEEVKAESFFQFNIGSL